MDVFYALAEPRRRTIVEILAKKGKMSATEISGNFDVSPQAISQHLKVLREVKLLKMKRQAQQRIYQLNTRSIHEVEEWAKHATELWDARLNRLDQVIMEEKENARKVR